MLKTSDLSRSIKDLHDSKMKLIALDAREKTLDLTLSVIAVVILAVASIFLF